MKSKTDFQNFEFNLKTKTKVGLGEALNLGRYLKEMSFVRIGVIVDGKISQLVYTQKIIESIKKEFFSAVKIWEYDLGSEPDYDSLDRIKSIFMDGNNNSLVDCFVGIGGGSVIDFAKGLATLATNPGNAINFRGFPTNINQSLATIALPTTAGTGSEVTFNAVFIDQKGKKKLGINTRYNFPALAILDPNLTLSCPKQVSISSGIDAIVHALEGYMSKKTDIITKIFARESFGLMFKNLPKVLKSPKDLRVRMNLQLGAYLGGLTLLGSGGGPTGALSYALGVNFKVPHGIAGGIFLPYIIEHNASNGYDYSELYDCIIESERKSHNFSKEIFALCRKINIPKNLKPFGVNKNNIEILLKEVENFEKSFAQNPTPFSVEDGKKLIMRLIN